MPRRRARLRPSYEEHDGPELFPGLERERERAYELFGIDVSRSLQTWVERMIGDEERALELLSRPRAADKEGLVPEEGDLSERERQVLTLAAAGYSTPETAAFLGLGAESVKTYRRHCIRKLRAGNTAHAVVLAILTGELDEDLLAEHVLRGWE